MNLIEQLGGYERAKAFLNAASYTMDELIMMQRSGVRPQHVEKALLDYRRQHNIFEGGDKVVWINSIAPNDPRLFEIEENLGEKPDAWSLRHATDAEIKAGKRLEVNE